MHEELAEALDVRELSEPAQKELAARILAALTSLAVRQRLELADKLHLPVTLRVLGRNAAPVLRLLIEDEPMRPFFANGAANLWLELEIGVGHGEALPAALGVAQDVSGMTLMSLASSVEDDERYEILAARLSSDPVFIDILSRAGGPLVHGEDRYIDAATRHLIENPVAAARLMRCVGTPRAMEELQGIVTRATEADIVVVVEALEGLRDLEAGPDVVVDLLGSPAVAALAWSDNRWRIAELMIKQRAAVEELLVRGGADTATARATYEVIEGALDQAEAELDRRRRRDDDPDVIG